MKLQLSQDIKKVSMMMNQSTSNEIIPSGEKAKQKPTLKSIAQNYAKQQMNFDKYLGQYISNELLKSMFNVTVKLSYLLFIAGVAILSKTDQQQRFEIIDYIKQPSKQPFLIVLILQAIIIITLFTIFKQENKITPLRRKQINFVTDITRSIFYTLLIIFVSPFILEREDNIVLLASFWVFIFALILFGVRKIVKWYYYFFTEAGKKIVEPWICKTIKTKDSLKKQSKFIDFMLQNIIKKRLELDLTNKDGIDSDLLSKMEKILFNKQRIVRQHNSSSSTLKIIGQQLTE